MKILESIRLKDPIVPWMVRHAGCLISRCRVQPNGRTPWEMIRGRKTNAPIAAFGEVIMFKIPKTKLNLGKFEDYWDVGVDLGFDMRSLETLASTPAGVFRVHDIRRRSIAERRCPDTPAQPVPGQRTKRSPAVSKRHQEPGVRSDEFVEQPEPTVPDVRDCNIFKSDVIDFGPTEHCPGCTAVIRGWRQRPHNGACRNRMRDNLMQTEKGRQRIQRAEERAKKTAEQPKADTQQGGGAEPPSVNAGDYMVDHKQPAMTPGGRPVPTPGAAPRMSPRGDPAPVTPESTMEGTRRA